MLHVYMFFSFYLFCDGYFSKIVDFYYLFSRYRYGTVLIFDFVILISSFDHPERLKVTRFSLFLVNHFF